MLDPACGHDVRSGHPSFPHPTRRHPTTSTRTDLRRDRRPLYVAAELLDGADGLILLRPPEYRGARLRIGEINVGVQGTAYESMMEGVNDFQRKQAWSWIDGPANSVFSIVDAGILIAVGRIFLPEGTSITVRVLASVAVVFLLARARSAAPALGGLTHGHHGGRFSFCYEA